MKFTLRQLEVFLAVAAAENVSKAADKLAMSQSAASGALQTLEQQYDTRLFDRVGKRLQLNSTGKHLQTVAQSLLEHAEEVEAELSGAESHSQIELGATLSIGNYLAVPLIAEYRQSHPNSRIQILVENTEHIVEKLLNFALDVALIEGVVHHEDLDISHWRDDELVVFCSSRHPFAQKGELNDDDLLTAQWILREAGSGTRQQVDHALHDLLPHLKIEMELQHTEAIKRAVELNLGISCLSRLTLDEAFDRGNLVPLRVPTRNFHRRLYLATHKEKYQSPALKDWLTFLRTPGVRP